MAHQVLLMKASATASQEMAIRDSEGTQKFRARIEKIGGKALEQHVLTRRFDVHIQFPFHYLVKEESWVTILDQPSPSR